MADTSTIPGALFETLKEEGGKVVKEVVKETAKSVNLLESLPPTTPEKVQQESMKYKQEKQIGLSKIRSELGSQIQTAPKKQEDRRIFQGAEKAERGQVNQNAQMNNQQLSANMKPQKKMEPLAVQQKRNNKLHGAG